jgi:hypothetical protein
VEPNNGPTLAGAQSLGSLAVGPGVVVTGRLATGGNNGTSYTGDIDLFSFTMAGPGALTVEVQWTGSADVDAYLYDAAANLLAHSADAARPAAIVRPLAAGTFMLALYSKDLPADWTMTLTLAAGPLGPSCTSPVTGQVAGGCSITNLEPANGASLSLPRVFGWMSNGGCSTPYHLVVIGNPPSQANAVYFDISTSPPNQPAASYTLYAEGLSQLQSDNGQYHWQVYNHAWEASSPAFTFTLAGSPACQ